MDKILEIGDVFGLDAQNLKWVLLIPVSIMVGAVAVFVFGFKKAESPKFRKLVSASSSKRKKRDTANATAPSSKPAKRQEASQKAASVKELMTPTAAEPKRTPERKQPVVKAATSGKTASNNNKVAKATTNNNNNAFKKITTDLGKQQQQKKQQSHELENDGEWQTVITKKQKKQIETAEVAENGNNSNKKAAKSKKEPSPKQQSKKSPKVVNVEAVPLVAPAEEMPQIKPQLQQQQKEEEAKVQLEPIAAAEVTVAAVAEPSTVKPHEVINNVVFDELSDAAWTETKPQRKSKVRALREH